MMIIIINVVISIYISIITAQKTGSRSTSGGTTAETVASSTAPPARDTRSLDHHFDNDVDRNDQKADHGHSDVHGGDDDEGC